jgi:hypothetical protein
MAEFEYQKKLEGWIEGILDVIQSYLWSVMQLTLHPIKTLFLFTSKDTISSISSPSVYFILSYLSMCLLIQHVDFSDRFFSVDIASRLDALGVLNAAKTIKVETLVASIFPAILLLLFFVIIVTTVLIFTGDTLESHLLRRNYSFALGGAFLTIGSLSGGYHYLVKPVASISWWLGLPLHILTGLPLISVICPILAIQYIGTPTGKQFFIRWLAIMIPMLGMLVIFKLTIGSFYLMDYMRLR